MRDPVRLLLLAVIRQAVWDARHGDLAAREWLLSAETRELALALDVPCWPPPGVAGGGRRVAEALSAPDRLARECIADLPPQDSDMRSRV